jgi:tetratricopeptide (TPR) repeat protein
MNQNMFFAAICVAAQMHVFSLLAQPTQDLDKYYDGGNSAFLKNLSESLRYPDRSTSGTALVKFSMFDGRVVSVEHLVSLGGAFDEEIARSIYRLEDYWTKIADTLSFIIPVKFRTADVDFYTGPYPEHYIDEIVVIGYRMVNGQQIESGGISTDQALIDRMNKALEKGKFNKALKPLDELLERNPVNQQLRETRIYCLNQLEQYKEACEEVTFIQNVLNKNSKQNCLQ